MEFDTTGTTWRLDLKRLPTQFVADIIYKKNMVEIKRLILQQSKLDFIVWVMEKDNQFGYLLCQWRYTLLEANTATYESNQVF